MRLFGRSKQHPRIVVREYGRDSFLGMLSPVFAALYVTVLGSQGRLRYEGRLQEQMEKDAAEMRRRGYRVTDQREYEMPPFGIHYHRVTYELPEGAP